MGNKTIITSYNKFVNLKIEHFLNRFQDKKIQLHVLNTLSSLSFMEEGSDYKGGDQKLKLFIHNSPYLKSANDNDYITHIKVEESNIKLFEFIKKCVQKDIRSRKSKMNEGRKKEEWTEYFKQLIHDAEYKDEYYQVFQERPAYTPDFKSLSNFNYSSNNLPIDYNILDFNHTGNNSLSDEETLKHDYSLLLIVFPFVACLVCFVCLFNYCMKKRKDQATNSIPSEEISLPLIAKIQSAESHNVELE